MRYVLVNTPTDALQAALLLGGRFPVLAGRRDYAWQRREAVPPRLPGETTAIVVALNNGGYDIRQVDRGRIGRLATRIRLREQRKGDR